MYHGDYNYLKVSIKHFLMEKKRCAPVKIVDLSMIHLSLSSAYGRFTANDLHGGYANSKRIACKLKKCSVTFQACPLEQRGIARSQISDIGERSGN